MFEINLINFIHKHRMLLWREKNRTYICVDHHILPDFLKVVGYNCDADGGIDAEILVNGDVVFDLTDTFCEYEGVGCDFLDDVIEIYDR